MPDIFGVIADATRRDILRVLLERQAQPGQPQVGEMSVSEIVAQLEMSQPTISKHLKVLRDAELVTVREEGQHRFYSLNAEPLEMVEDFVIPFLSAGFETEVTVEYVSESGEVLPDPELAFDGFDQGFSRESSAERTAGYPGERSGEFAEDGEVLPDSTAAAAERLGRAAARAEHRVKELVARFRLHD